jgi:chromosome segregation ATPase
MRKFQPDFEIPYSLDSLSGILEVLPSTIESICQNFTSEITEKYQAKEDSFKRTSKNLVKYEELLKEKALELDEERKAWESLKDEELSLIETKKNELIKAKVLLDREFEETRRVLNEKEEKIEKEKNEIENLRNQVHKSHMKNQELEWKIQQTIREIEEKEEILKMKEELIMKDKEEVLAEMSIVENEKMVNKVLNLELIKGNLEVSRHKRCSSVAFNLDTNRSYASESPEKCRPSSQSDSKIEETSFIISKQSFVDIVNTKKSLEASAKDVEEIQTEILPNLHETTQEIQKLFDRLSELKEALECTVEEINEKSEEYNEKIRSLDEGLKNSQEQNREVEKVRKENDELKVKLQTHINQLALEKEKFDEECQDFHKEKLEFYEDVSKERQRIQNYYSGIEEKVHLLEIKREELQKANKSLKEKEISYLLKKDHVRNKSTYL